MLDVSIGDRCKAPELCQTSPCSGQSHTRIISFALTYSITYLSSNMLALGTIGVCLLLGLLYLLLFTGRRAKNLPPGTNNTHMGCAPCSPRTMTLTRYSRPTHAAYPWKSASDSTKGLVPEVRTYFDPSGMLSFPNVPLPWL